jgi:hypothetical protein
VVAPAAFLGSGAWMLHAQRRVGSTMQEGIVRVDGRGQRELVALPLDPCAISGVADGQPMHLRNPTCPRGMIVATPAGDGLVMVSPGEVTRANATAVVRRISADGRTTRTDSIRLRPKGISSAMKDSVKRTFDRPGIPEAIANAAKRLPFPDRVVPIRRMVAGRADAIALEVLRDGAAPGWLVMVGGAIRGEARLAGGEEPLALTHRELWTKREHESGYTSVTRYVYR